MPLARLRRSSRFVALLLLASFWSLAHRGSDDACLTVVAEAHDESKHVLAAASGSTPEHCAVCHAVRTPRPPLGSAPAVRSPLDYTSVVPAGNRTSLRSPALEQRPARAPPASLT